MQRSAEELSHLLARCALGDKQSFEQLYQSSSAQLFGLILRIVKNQDIAAEILQESYVKIWNRAGDYRIDKAQPMTWMGTVARNQAIDTLRRSANQILPGEPVEQLYWLADEGPEPDEMAHTERQNDALRACLEQLEGLQKEALLLAYFRGMTHEELAAHLGKPLGTVKSWLRRGLQRLKNCLEQA
jgi:RNA polymerase sigma-70 factor (ECF subfamily)